jgi:hypothetical protein
MKSVDILRAEAPGGVNRMAGSALPSCPPCRRDSLRQGILQGAFKNRPAAGPFASCFMHLLQGFAANSLCAMGREIRP